MRKIKTITSYAGLHRWLDETTAGYEPLGFLARCQVEDIPSPYSYSPTKAILEWQGKPVVYFETRHKRYEVYEVPAELLRFKTDQEACDWHIRYGRKPR